MPLLLGGIFLVGCTADRNDGAPPAEAQAGPPLDLTVMVYNIHAGRDAQGEPNLARVVDLVETQDPDLVLLQEVDRLTERSLQVDQAVRLAGLTHRSWAFGQSLDFQGGMYGIATLSRWPVPSHATHPLPAVPRAERAGGSTEPRVALEVQVATPAGPVWALNTHLDPADEEVRLQELDRLLDRVEALRSAGESVLVGGDLNAEPGSAVHDRLVAAGLTDAHELCGNGAGHTYPADEPTKRIDYLWLPSTWTCTGATVLEDQSSDHRPLLVRIGPPVRPSR